jgi:hypothetical protein
MKEILRKKDYKINEYNFSFKEIESLWKSRELEEVLRKSIKWRIWR